MAISYLVKYPNRCIKHNEFKRAEVMNIERLIRHYALTLNYSGY